MLPVLAKARIRVNTTMEEMVMNIIKESQGKNNLEVHQGNLYLLGIKLYFLVIAILYKLLAHGKIL